MPIYEYQCRKCKHQFEKLLRHTDETPECPSCHGRDLERLISTPAVSTEDTRNRAFTAARRKAMETKREKDHAQREYERNYIKNHS